MIELKDDTREDLYLIGSCAHSPGKTGADHALWSLPGKNIPSGRLQKNWESPDLISAGIEKNALQRLREHFQD